jgi:hypothetical protein
MYWYEIITVLHVIGAAIGVGAAVSSDAVFMASIRNRRISHGQYLLIHRSSTVVIGGLTLLVITGIILLLMNPELWRSDHFLAKMTVVIILMVNGLIFHAKVIPLLRNYLHTTMPKHFIAAQQRLLSITGATSAVCWLAALVIASIGNIGIDYFTYIALVVFFIAIGSVGAHLVLEHIIFRRGTTVPESHKEPKGDKQSMILLSSLLILLVASLLLVIFFLS